MSQKLLIHLYGPFQHFERLHISNRLFSDASRERREEEDFEDAAITISKNISTHRDISRVVRTNFDKSRSSPFEFSRRARNSLESNESPEHVDVQVRIEKTVKLNHYTRTYELEDYSRRTRG